MAPAPLAAQSLTRANPEAPLALPRSTMASREATDRGVTQLSGCFRAQVS